MRLSPFTPGAILGTLSVWLALASPAVSGASIEPVSGESLEAQVRALRAPVAKKREEAQSFLMDQRPERVTRALEAQLPQLLTDPPIRSYANIRPLMRLVDSLNQPALARLVVRSMPLRSLEFLIDPDQERPLLGRDQDGVVWSEALSRSEGIEAVLKNDDSLLLEQKMDIRQNLARVIERLASPRFAADLPRVVRIYSASSGLYDRQILVSAIGRFGTQEARDELVSLLRQTSFDNTLEVAMVNSLGGYDLSDLSDALRDSVSRKTFMVRLQVAIVLCSQRLCKGEDQELLRQGALRRSTSEVLPGQWKEVLPDLLSMQKDPYAVMFWPSWQSAELAEKYFSQRGMAHAVLSVLSDPNQSRNEAADDLRSWICRFKLKFPAELYEALPTEDRQALLSSLPLPTAPEKERFRDAVTRMGHDEFRVRSAAAAEVRAAFESNPAGWIGLLNEQVQALNDPEIYQQREILFSLLLWKMPERLVGKNCYTQGKWP